MSDWRKVNNNRYDISSIIRVTRSFWKFDVVVVHNNGKEMYKKSVLHVLNRPIVVSFTVLFAFAA